MDNIDQHEVNKFNQLAQRWWDRNSEFKPLHDINPLRLQFIEQAASLENKTAIDVGCGGGILTESLRLRGANVTGIDLAKQVLQIAKLHALESKLEINYQLISAEEMAAQSPAQFDIVTCMELLEHVPDPGSLIQACATLVKPGGHLFFSTINRNPKAYLFAILGAEYILRMLPRGTHNYKKFLRPSELDYFLRQAGLNLISMKGISYHPLLRKYQLSADISVNYMIHCQRSISITA